MSWQGAVEQLCIEQWKRHAWQFVTCSAMSATVRNGLCASMDRAGLSLGQQPGRVFVVSIICYF